MIFFSVHDCVPDQPEFSVFTKLQGSLMHVQLSELL